MDEKNEIQKKVAEFFIEMENQIDDPDDAAIFVDALAKHHGGFLSTHYPSEAYGVLTEYYGKTVKDYAEVSDKLRVAKSGGMYIFVNLNTKK